MNRDAVRKRIEEVGIVPAIRVLTYEDALFAAAAVYQAGIPIVEVTMTVPGAIDLIAQLVKTQPDLIVGAGTVFETDIAEQCIDAGVQFLTSTGLDLDIVKIAQAKDVVIFPGVLTPTEIQTAQKAGCDFVKVFPCSQVGGPSYVRALRGPFPKVQMIASGGVTQTNAGEFIASGAVALGIGGELIPRKAIRMKESHWIHELARRFSAIVREARGKLLPS
jgi:2-dehydro-3-deoxyphosphogluconate aldolase/(4S)-4-hydroxy-2-oxoglutarate aldolase